jgi:hypothetical protein
MSVKDREDREPCNIQGLVEITFAGSLLLDQLFYAKHTMHILICEEEKKTIRQCRSSYCMFVKLRNKN